MTLDYDLTTSPAVDDDAGDTRVSPWRAGAACAGLPTSWWFADADNQLVTAAAIAVCVGCPVRTPCLDAALAEEGSASWAVHGVRGGYSAGARRRMLRARAALTTTRVVVVPGRPVELAPVDIKFDSELDRRIVHLHHLFAAAL